MAHGRLVESGRTVAVAESLTGGLISAVLTEAPGTTVTFRGGLVVYATDLKHRLAGVREDDLDESGPVDPSVAEQFASGARDRLRADYGIGVTGVAGPTEQDGHPVGEVFVAVASADATTVTRHQLEGNRAELRLAAATAALADFVGVLDAATARSRDSA